MKAGVPWASEMKSPQRVVSLTMECFAVLRGAVGWEFPSTPCFDAVRLRKGISKGSVLSVNGISVIFGRLRSAGWTLRSTNPTGLEILGLVAKDTGR